MRCRWYPPQCTTCSTLFAKQRSTSKPCIGALANSIQQFSPTDFVQSTKAKQAGLGFRCFRCFRCLCFWRVGRWPLFCGVLFWSSADASGFVGKHGEKPVPRSPELASKPKKTSKRKAKPKKKGNKKKTKKKQSKKKQQAHRRKKKPVNEWTHKQHNKQAQKSEKE